MNVRDVIVNCTAASMHCCVAADVEVMCVSVCDELTVEQSKYTPTT